MNYGSYKAVVRRFRGDAKDVLVFSDVGGAIGDVGKLGAKSRRHAIPLLHTQFRLHVGKPRPFLPSHGPGELWFTVEDRAS